MSIGTVSLYDKVVLKEVKVHLNNSEKNSIKPQLEFDEYEFSSFQAREFSDAEEVVIQNDGLLGTSDEDQILLYIALINDCDLITNEYALADLSKAAFNLPDLSEHKDKKIFTAEDLVLCALAEGKLVEKEVQALLDAWGKAGEYVMNIKKSDFTSKGFTIPTPRK